MTVAPFIQRQTLADPGGGVNDHFGWAVALSGDGATALIGAYGTNTASVFTRGASSYTQCGPTLSAGGDGSFNGFGNAVALSADGATALVGASYTNTAYVFAAPATLALAPGTGTQHVAVDAAFATSLAAVATIRGTNVGTSATVSFCGMAVATASVVDATTIRATTPAAGTADIAVPTNGQTASTHGFTYLPASGGILPQPGLHPQAGGAYRAG